MRKVWIAFVVPCLFAIPGVARAEKYSDDDLGYSITIPQGWRGIPIAAEEQFIVARWQSDREYFDKKEGWSHRPDLKVVLFDPKGKKSAEVSDKGDGVKSIEIHNPYKNYKDWVKSDSSGGRYISKEEEIVVGGVPTTWYEVAYEKLTTPRHGLAFVYHAADIDYCVTTEVLQEQWAKLSPALVQCLKTFKIFPRKGTVKRETTGEGSDVVIDENVSKLSPEERLKRREQVFERKLKLATERLTAGWTVKRSKNYVAISHTDDKYTQLILDQAEGVREWADENLPFFGDGLPGPELLRICKDWDEERSFTDLSARSSGWVQEITLSRDERFYGLGSVGGRIFDRWLRDKNPRLAYSLPPWLGSGIREWIGSAYIKGGKLEFRADGDLVVALKLAAKQGSLIPPRDMVQMTYDDLYAKDKDSGGGGSVGGIPLRGFGQTTSAWQQAAGLVRYLLQGPGKSAAKTKDLIKCYVVDLDTYVKEKDGAPEAVSASSGPKTEEEEDAQFKNRQSYWKDHEKDLLTGVYLKVFGEWTDADWASLEKSYRNYSK